MTRTAIERDELGDATVDILVEALKASGESMRALHRASGVKLTRLQSILSAGAPIYVDELDALAATLGLTASDVLAEAEFRIGRHGVGLEVAALDPGYDPDGETT